MERLGRRCGVLAIALLVLGLERTRSATETPGRALVTAAFALGLLGATALAVFTGEASVQIAPVDVQVETTLWPAWVGFALAIVVAAAALVPFLDLSEVERGPHRAPPHEAT
jgi:hypothetical protein